MNVPCHQEELYVSGFDSEIRLRDRDDSVSLAKSIDMSDQGLVVGSKAHINASGHQRKTSPTSTSTARRRREDGAIEVDFYRNPTVLSRMVLYNKFSNASKRCRDHPEEASVWVCAKRKSNATGKSPIHTMFDRSQSARSFTSSTTQQQQQEDSTEYSMRQLPIHLACTSLAFAHDSLQRAELEQLIVRLVVTYPQGCGEFDHGGRLPLHEAIWSASSAQTISMLLMASPRSIDKRDKFGRTPKELNSRRHCASGDSAGINLKQEIRDMLNLGAPYWEQARDEARFRMKLAVVPPSGGSVTSTGVLGSSLAGKETLVTGDDDDDVSTSQLPHKKSQTIQIQSEEITPISWEQLERRVLFLEQLLAEMFETNYELAGAVEELKKAKKAVEAKLELARAQQTSNKASSSRGKRGRSARTRPRSSAGSQSLSVDTIPEDDEASIAELIDHVESLVGSYHSSKRHQRSPTSGDGSTISELSVFSSSTLESSIPSHPVGRPSRSNSLVSGLTMSEDSFDPSNKAVKTTDSNVGEVFMADAAKKMADPSPRRGWTAPIASSSFTPVATTPMLVEEEDSTSDGLSPSGNSMVEENNDRGREVEEIYFPGFMVAPAHSQVDSTLSITGTASSIATSSSDESFMSESTKDTNEDDVTADEVSQETMSTRARFIENMVFGGTEEPRRADGDSPVDPARYNYDIQIPALDPYYGPDTGEI